MLCNLSGQIPVEPVVSIKSGHVFEKRLLLKYLEQNQQRCPVTNEELDAERDIVAIQVQPIAASNNATSVNGSSKSNNLSAFSPEAASIPQLLATFQNEWDAVMLETFTLKQHLEKTRQELSHALYQHDAACRVIARLNAENSSLRSKLTQLASGATATANGEGDVEMDDGNDSLGLLSAEVLATIDAKQKELAKQRKEFKKKDGPARAELLKELASSWTTKSSHTIHDAEKPGVLAIGIDPKNPDRVVTGGVDKHAKVFDTSTQQIVATLNGHSKKISHTEFHPTADLIVTASYDKTVKIWTPKEASYGVGHSLNSFDDAVTMTSIHPTGNYILGSSLDASWAIHDVRNGKIMAKRFLNGETTDPKNVNANNEARCISFHPDGGIFGTGSKSKLVQMWAVNSLTNVISFEGHSSPVNTLSFSENGYHLASGSEDGIVKFWDLRKAKCFFEVDLNAGKKKKIGPIHEVTFDRSGTYLAVASSQIQVLKEASKNEWGVVKTLEDHKAAVTGIKFAPNSSYLASTSMDRSLKIYR